MKLYFTIEVINFFSASLLFVKMNIMLTYRELLKRVVNYNDSKSIGSRFRQNRLELFLPMINNVFKEHGAVNIIDIGGTETYWNILSSEILDKKKINITIVNLPGAIFVPRRKHFFFKEADACNLAIFKDKSFHIAHSNSVIEHVGDWRKMVQFAHEIKRVAPRYFIQTPNYWFPIEPHCMTPFFHWLPKPSKIWLVMQFGLGNWERAKNIHTAVKKVERIHLLNSKMFSALFSEAVIKKERVIGFSKSLIAIKS